ncbi:MAG: hypothetical protein Q4C77_03465 [Eubacteriales bacterium]|nr:hypothetical protein [Eubacteriales bacterium]
MNNIIYNELWLGMISDTSRDTYARIIGRLKDNGAEGVILGCTEIGHPIPAATATAANPIRPMSK